MALPTASEINGILDAMILEYLRVLGSAGDGIAEAGSSYGMSDKIADGQAIITASTNPKLQAALQNEYALAISSTSALAYWKGRARARLRALNAFIKSEAALLGITAVDSLDTLLTYYNTGAGGTWTALQDYNWRALYSAWLPGRTPNIANLYCEILQGTFNQATHLYTRGLGKVEPGSTFTDGATEGLLLAGGKVDETKYVGGIPYLKVVSRTGTDTVTITGDGYDPALQATFTGKKWTVTVNATGDLLLVGGGSPAAPANALMTNATASVAGASLSALEAYVILKRPSGRDLLQ